MAVLQPSGISILVSYIIFNCFSIVAVICRFVGIRIRRRGVKAHDYLCVLALLCSVAYSIDTLIGTVDGQIGLHVMEAAKNPKKLTLSLKAFFASEWFWATAVCSFRISILLLYSDLFTSPRFRAWAYGFIAVVVTFWIGSVIEILTSCRPLQKIWYTTLPGRCADIGAAELAVAAINMALDMCIVALPLPVIWRLQMPKHKKIGVSVTFALGLSVAGINLARIIKIIDCNVEDFTYCTKDSAILTVAETATGVVVACIPTLGAVVFPRRFGPSAQIKDEGRQRLRDSPKSQNPQDWLNTGVAGFGSKRRLDDYEAIELGETKSEGFVDSHTGFDCPSTEIGAVRSVDPDLDAVKVTKDIHVTAEDARSGNRSRNSRAALNECLQPTL